MLTVTPEFKNALKEPVKDTSGYLVLHDGTELRPDGILQNYTIESVGGFLRTAMSKITVNILGEHDLIDDVADVYYGVFHDGDYEYVLRGKFTITDATYKKDKDTTTLTGYDNMMQFGMQYTTVGAYPSTLFEYLQAVASLAGVVLENTEVYNGTLTMPEDYYMNASEYTIRDVLEDICEATASYALINSQGHLELRQMSNTGETLTYSNLLKYELGEYWGGINSVVLSRQPQNDDVFIRDEEDIESPTTRNVMNLSRFTTSYSAEES